MILTWINKIREAPIVSVLVIVVPILGGITTVYNFGKIWNGLGLPRMAWWSEVQDLQQKIQDINRRVWELELEYRRNQIKVDQRALRELEKQIINMQQLNQQVPDHVSEYRDLLENQISEHRNRINMIQQQLNAPR